ncbi:hypothetical protein PILCRDRAFT_90705 [Piloderma croceum F 1598]|uniref:XPG N-terminal domain-containing protein n=1 Tax=Piloderma croceum (strain F 1598) TaxID=765440 RepID=A0A0C3FEF0_PILCF|nr:hypothetical protein PILCRDRAFT_90705 [Piloderma croceum F 1598]
MPKEGSQQDSYARRHWTGLSCIVMTGERVQARACCCESTMIGRRREHDIKTLFGHKVAIDASMSIYQFLIAVRQKDGEMLTNDAGETTSHLMGFFYRTIRIVENGIKPAYVFDGKTPELKAGVLSKRFEKRVEAKEEGEEAKETQPKISIVSLDGPSKLPRSTMRNAGGY